MGAITAELAAECRVTAQVHGIDYLRIICVGSVFNLRLVAILWHQHEYTSAQLPVASLSLSLSLPPEAAPMPSPSSVDTKDTIDAAAPPTYPYREPIFSSCRCFWS